MGLDYTIQYRKGKENIAADALSRCHEEGSLAAVTVVTPQWYEEVISSYVGDQRITTLMEKLTVREEEVEGYTLKKGILRFQGCIVIGDKTELKRKIIQALHESPLGGYSGEQNTYVRVKGIFYWPRMKTEIKEFMQACDVCKRCKTESVPYLRLLQPLPIPKQAWSSVLMDFIDGLPRSEGKGSDFGGGGSIY